jgi:hypothetical protein
MRWQSSPAWSAASRPLRAHQRTIELIVSSV